MSDSDEKQIIDDDEDLNRLVQEVISMERRYYFEKRHGRTERQRELQRVIERHVTGDSQR